MCTVLRLFSTKLGFVVADATGVLGSQTWFIGCHQSSPLLRVPSALGLWSWEGSLEWQQGIVHCFFFLLWCIVIWGFEIAPVNRGLPIAYAHDVFFNGDDRSLARTGWNLLVIVDLRPCMVVLSGGAKLS